MKKSESMSSQRRVSLARIDRVLAMMLCLLMLMGLMPAQALAALADGETVVAVAAPSQAAYTVDAGTALADVGLPSELTVTVATPPAEEGGETGTRTEAVAIEWRGGYAKDTPGNYPLTASFAADGYSFAGAMPIVTVTVREVAVESQSEPETASFTPKKLNIDASDKDNDLKDVPDFYAPVLEKADDTETALFCFTDGKDTVQYRVYGTYGELIGFFACKKDGSAPNTDAVVDVSNDRASLPVANTAKNAEAIKECTCDPKPAEGEAHQEGCPLYDAPEATKECTCDRKPAEGEAHQEGCPLYVATKGTSEAAKKCTCDPKPAEGEAHEESCPLYVAPAPAPAPAPAALLSEKADAFVQAVDKLDKDAVLAAVVAYKAARDAANASPDDTKLQEAAGTANVAVADATKPVAEAMELYDEVPLNELAAEQVVAANTKLTDIVTAVDLAMNTQPVLMGTLGGTADKLDGDWAYLETFALLDDPATTGVVEGIQDGAGPFDTSDDPASMSYKGRQGNDENAQNGKVRSFDTITYKLNYATATSGEYDYVKEGWMEYKMALPYSATEAVWQTDSMTWVGTKVADQAGLDGIDERTSGYYLTTETIGGVTNQVLRGKFWLAPNETNPYAIPGEGTLSAVVQVLAMEENDTVAPTFFGWMAHNSVDPSTCATHGRTEVKTFTAPDTDVTAEVRLDIEVLGSVVDRLSSVDFNAGDTDAPNYGVGTLTGKSEAYQIGIYLWNGTLDGKGRKGLMAPQSGDTMSFDLTMDALIHPTAGGGADINIANTDYAPLLWALGSNDNAMDWRGRTSLTTSNYEPALAANTAFSTFLKGKDACYDGGNWSFTVDPSDPNKIHVTITSMEIDLTNFPVSNMAGTYSYITSGAIPISTGQLQLLQPVVKADGTHIMEDTSFTGTAIGHAEVWTSLRDDKMSYTYVSKADNQSHTLVNGDQTNLTDDGASLGFYVEKASGRYDSHVVWSNAPTGSNLQWIFDYGAPMGDTTGGKYYLELGGDPAVRNQNIGAWFGLLHYNDVAGDGGMLVAGKSLLKFDSSAVVPTGVVETQNWSDGYNRTVLFATKADGSAWSSDDEMETTSMTALKYYNSISSIPNGHKCIGVLVEYLPQDDQYTGVGLSDQWMYSDAGLTVRSDAVEDGLYQCTIENYGWDKNAYEAAGQSIPSLLNSSTLPAESFHWQPEYRKGTINAQNGHLEGNTGGYKWGDTMQIICARSVITKEVAQQENGVNKSIYYMDSDQRFVDYKLNVSTKYVTNGVTTPPVGVQTTLTILDAMPNGIAYVPNSAYYGGTYTQNAVPGRQGTVTGGTPLALKDSWEDGGFTWYKFEIPNVIVGDPLQPVYLTAKIGTRGVEATDVTDGQHIRNNALSQVGKEITTERDDVGLNQGFAEIVIAKNSAVSRSKLADKSYIENSDTYKWTVNVGNNGGSTMPNALLLDVFPYSGDGHGTAYTGALSLTKWNVDVATVDNFNSTNWKIMYTTDPNVRGTKSSEYTADVQQLKNGEACGPNNVEFIDITTLSDASVNWTTGVVTLPAGFSPTAIVMVGALSGGSTMRVNVDMQITNGKQGDILVNTLDGYPSPIYTVERAIEGCTWIDLNKDGVRQDSETMLPGVKAELLKLKAGGDATVETDYEPVMDEHNVAASVQTGKQKDAATGTETAYEAGRYQFTNFGPGTYAVRFTSGDTLIDNYTASPINQGLDESRDSDATPTYNATHDKLLQTAILGIVMAEANNTMRDIKQVSRNNDSGLYLDQFALTVSKTVTQGSKTKDFTFTVYLANGTTPLTGTFNYTGSAITGVTAPSNGTITLAGGNATITLRHGQSVSIAGIPAGTNYSVTETAPGTGWTPSPANRIIGGTLNAPATAAFSNSYAVLPGAYTAPAVTKTLSGALHTGFNATFSATIAAVSTTAAGLTAATMPMPGTTTVTTPAFTATGTQSFAAFGAINYTLAGQYVYRITEDAVSAAGVTRDQSEYTLTVDVADVNGQLTATPVVTKTKDASGSNVTPPTTVTGAINFANGYAPTSTTVAVVTPAKALRVSAGNALPNNYSEAFTATIAAVSNGAPMPANNSVSTGAFTAAGNQNFAAFGSITFTAAGTYVYTIKESIPTTAATPGMTYDQSEYQLSVGVADDAGRLVATTAYTRVRDAEGRTVSETVTGVTFENVYAPAPATLASGAITVEKTLTGAVLPTAKAFGFTLTHNATVAGPAAGVALSAPTTISTAAVTQGADIPTTANFGSITFNRVGTYTFTVEETASGINNMTDAASQTVTVQVTDTNGVLAATVTSPVGGGALTFTNDYHPTPATLQLGVTKTLTIDTPLTQLPSASTFTFALTHQPTAEGPAANVTMPAQTTVTTASMQVTGTAAEVYFGNIAFSRVGTYTFLVAEQDPGIHGMTLPSAQTVTVAVTDTNGTLSANVTAPASGKDLSFTNLYSPPPARVPITVIKRIVGAGAKLPSNKTFTFDLAKVTTGTYEGVTMPASLTVTTGSINSGSTTPVSFGNIEFMQEGTYEFTVSERASNIPGMTDAASQTVRIKTEIHGTAPNEVMSYEFVNAAGATIATGGTLTFDNTYAPTAAEITDAQLNVKKAIGGVGGTLPAARAFTFTLARTDGGAANAVTMPTGTGLTATTAPIQTGTSAAVGFGKITFHAAGTYTFSVTETQGSIPGLTYAGPQTVTVRVTDDATGALNAAIVISAADPRPTSGELTFTNTYAPKEAKLTSAALNMKKTVAGHILPTAKAFTFTLSRTDGGSSDAVVLSAPTSVTTTAIRFGDAVPIGFGDITFKAAGTYTFSIAETASGITGMTDAAAQTVTVRVTDTNGVLSAAITSGGTPPSGALTFINTYEPRRVTTADLPVQKIVDGAFAPSTADTFRFVLTPIRYTAPDGWTNTMTPAQMPVPAQTELSITGPASKEFGAYDYTMAGTYVYTVTETAGTNPDYTYDGSVYTYTDVVTDNNGTLTYARTMTKPGLTPNPTAAVFTNTYNRPMGRLTVRKTVSGGGDPNALFAFRFTFSEATRYDYVKSDATTGTVATGESLSLKNGESVTVTIHQGVTYTVVEDAYMSYVPTPASRTFTGSINATESVAAYANRFDPPYIPPDPTLTGNLTVLKQVTGDLADRYKYFSFRIELSDAGSYYYTGSISGMIASGDTILLRHGEYITILNLPAGTTYSVTEGGNSGYRVYTSGDVGIIAANRISVAAFTNSRSKVPATGDDNAALKGMLLMLGALSGGAVLMLLEKRLRRRRRRARTVR